MIVLCFGVRWEVDLSILMSNVICVCLNKLIVHCNIGMHLIDNTELFHSRIYIYIYMLVSARRC